MRPLLLTILVCCPYILMPSNTIFLHEYAAHTYVLSSMVLSMCMLSNMTITLQACWPYVHLLSTSILPHLHTDHIRSTIAFMLPLCICHPPLPSPMPMLHISTHALPIYVVCMSGIVFALRTCWPHTVSHCFTLPLCICHPPFPFSYEYTVQLNIYGLPWLLCLSISQDAWVCSIYSSILITSHCD